LIDFYFISNDQSQNRGLFLLRGNVLRRKGFYHRPLPPIRQSADFFLTLLFSPAWEMWQSLYTANEEKPGIRNSCSGYPKKQLAECWHKTLFHVYRFV
jgi:hypothetical protein